ncbi:hypothetical protein BDQ12DRAFT_670399 [Crucibulum laeve]|uniref:Uncharacterized protein n=1 Tax=Crucibulum laeve TaxID=68775 RepID=A0A5C3LK78_9AGAR|nr:hypothetical protein BDQ12DRAFT_670399 [Crucibulum laeve]
MSAIPVICFGPNPGTFYVGCGIRYHASNMPPSILNTISKLPAIHIKWMSTDFVSFGPNKGNWFAGAPGGRWNGDMEDQMIAQINEVRAITPNFDQLLDGVLFGKGTTQIFMYKGGFGYYTDKEAEGSKLEQDPQSDSVDMHWSLPPGMLEKLQVLRAEAFTSESQLMIRNYENLHKNVAINRINSSMAAIDALNGDTSYCLMQLRHPSIFKKRKKGYNKLGPS